MQESNLEGTMEASSEAYSRRFQRVSGNDERRLIVGYIVADVDEA